MRHRSYIRWFNNYSGFGFLQPVEGVEGDIAIRHDSFVDRVANERIELHEGDVVTFELEDVGRGWRAANSRRAGHVLASDDEWHVLEALVSSGGKLAYLRLEGRYRVTGASGLEVSVALLESLLQKRLIEAATGAGLYQISQAGRRAHAERAREMREESNGT